MLTVLRIKNLALVENAELTFGPGFNVLTGESGSGKSAIVDALALVAGATRPRLRARSGCQSGLAEAEFWPERKEDGSLLRGPLAEVLDQHGLLEACADAKEAIVLARRIQTTGRSRCFIQGQIVSRAALSAVGEQLLELCGQSEAHGLRTPAAQLDALDQFGGLTAERRRCSALVKKLRTKISACEEARLFASEAERRRDFLEFQLAELRNCDLNDLPEKRARLEELKSAQKARSSHEQVVQSLRSSAHAVLPQLNWLICRLDQTEGAAVEAVMDDLQMAVDHLQSASHTSTVALNESPRDAEELRELDEALDAADTLAAKHRLPTDELPTRLKEIQIQLEDATKLEIRYQTLLQETDQLRQEADVAAEKLHVARSKVAILLERGVKKELKSVGLGDAQLSTHLSRGELSSTGITHLEIRFSANPGHDAQALSRVASGGELARVLLCFRLATESSGALLSFDEIDAGAGGQTADQIAKALLRAGQKGQVLCVTHWAQVAGVAQTHFTVTKAIIAGQAATQIAHVKDDQRLIELSRMLGGAIETARRHASRLVDAA